MTETDLSKKSPAVGKRKENNSIPGGDKGAGRGRIALKPALKVIKRKKKVKGKKRKRSESSGSNRSKKEKRKGERCCNLAGSRQRFREERWYTQTGWRGEGEKKSAEGFPSSSPVTFRGKRKVQVRLSGAGEPKTGGGKKGAGEVRT